MRQPPDRRAIVMQPLRSGELLTDRSASRSALLPGLRCREIGVLLRDPIDKFANGGVRQQTLDIHAIALQFRIGEVRDQGLLANRVHRHHIAASPALGDGVMPDNCLASRPTA